MKNSKRDRVKDAIADRLQAMWPTLEESTAYELAAEIADEVFYALGISEKAQDRP